VSIGIVVFPIWAVFAFFPQELLFVWTNSHVIAKNSGTILSILATGNMLNLMTHVIFNVLLANAYTRLSVIGNSISVILLIPLIFILVHFYGVIGGASVWVILNTLYMTVAAYFVFRKFLKTEKWKWYINDIFRFAVPCILPVIVLKYCMRFMPETRFRDIGILGSSLVICFVVMLVVTPRPTRQQIINILVTRKFS
jgi:O-antigen/teichoic acid export membrane protein